MIGFSSRTTVFRYSPWEPSRPGNTLKLIINQGYGDYLITQDNLRESEGIHQLILPYSPQECVWRGTDFLKNFPGSMSHGLAPLPQDWISEVIFSHFPAEKKLPLIPPKNSCFSLYGYRRLISTARHNHGRNVRYLISKYYECVTVTKQMFKHD